MSKNFIEKASAAIRDVPDFPEPGIVFKDITPLLLRPDLLEGVVERMAEEFRDSNVEKILAIESRGFILGAPVALRLGVGLALARKAGKLPWKRHRVEYALEYGTDVIEVHVDAISAGERVVVVDDVLATGGDGSGCGKSSCGGGWQAGWNGIPPRAAVSQRSSEASRCRRPRIVVLLINRREAVERGDVYGYYQRLKTPL